MDLPEDVVSKDPDAAVFFIAMIILFLGAMFMVFYSMGWIG